MHLLLLFLHLFDRIAFSILLLYQPLFFHKLFIFYTLVKKLYNIYNSICYVLNYYYPYWIPPCIIVVVGKHTIILQRSFFYFYSPLEAFRNHRSNLWYSLYNKEPMFLSLETLTLIIVIIYIYFFLLVTSYCIIKIMQY